MIEPLTESQALAIADVLAKADGGCIYCARDLAGRMKRIDPDRDWTAIVLAAYKRDMASLDDEVEDG